MPQGLQIFDAGGMLIFDSSKRFLSLITEITVNATGATTLPTLPGADFVATTVPGGDFSDPPDEAFIDGDHVDYVLNGSAASRNVRVFLA